MVYKEISKIADRLEEKIIKYRRDFHKHAETGWTEFRTASLVAKRLDELDYELKIGKEVIEDESRMGVPDKEELERHYERAKDQGDSTRYLNELKGGFTGVVGILKNGPGPTIAFRFDLDALKVQESTSEDHFPFREGFASINENTMHACGHDGHTSIGLALAETLMEIKDNFSGKIKLIFQPAEEGVRGAKSMMEAGVVDDVDYLFGMHLGGSDIKSGEISPGRKGFLATEKFDVHFTGSAAHAGGEPEKGDNALLAASSAIQNLYAIARHSEGQTRINVGSIEAGTGRNVIPKEARLKVETRGEDSELNDYMYNRACKILEKTAEMYDLELKIDKMGAAESAESDQELVEKVKTAAEKIDDIEKVKEDMSEGGGSEDFTYFMKRVQEQDGQATYIKLGTETAGDAHTKDFDFEEHDLKTGVKLLAGIAYHICSSE